MISLDSVLLGRRRLPWHSWNLIDNYRQAEIAFSSMNYRKPPPPNDSNSIKILGILGYSAGIDIEKDRELLESLPNAEIFLLVEPKSSQVNDQLWEQPWDIIFFAGHGKTTENEGQISINADESISINDIWLGLRKAVDAGLQLAIFNSCDGLGLLSSKLANDVQIPQMIVMRDLVPDRVAQAFLKYFLTAFSGGKPLYLAAREAREHLHGMENEYPCASWLPIIWQNPAAIPFAWPLSPKDLLPQSKSQKPPIALSVPWLLGIVAGCLGSYLLLGHQGAVLVNKLGVTYHKEGKFLAAAQRSYQIAALLDINYAAPHYNLGWLCDESLQDIDCAIRAYQRATFLGRTEATAELARLHINQGNHNKALAVIHHCLEQTEYLHEYPAVAAACWKNLGWVRWQQNRWQETDEDLRKAIALEPDSPHAHCLLAKVLEARGDLKAALEHWQDSLQSLKRNVPEQDSCIAVAKQRLQKGGD